ncbi:MAG: transposon-encoded TnpW family protein [Lachnospiraceae bacterium]|nr:transposon-encoded TnpW family protein [Lachnospiraceae bacterium]
MEFEAIHTTSTYIGDTLFIVESVTADSTKETAADKVKWLILGNLDEMLKKAS